MRSESGELSQLPSNLACEVRDYDRTVYETLETEIIGAQEDGIDVSVAPLSVDKGYGEKLSVVNARLDGMQRVYEDEAAYTRKRHLGGAILERVGIVLPRQLRGPVKRLRDELDEQRRQILYMPIEAEPWFEQCGRAAALATITSAFNLVAKDEMGDGYSVMGGPLAEASLHRPFIAAGNVVNMTVLDVAGVSGRPAKKVATHLRKTHDFLDASVTEGFRDIVQYCWDGIGIRERKEAVNRLIVAHLEGQAMTRPVGDMVMMSVGCGTALPVMEAMAQVKQKTGQAPTLILLDQDPIALKLAEELAMQYDLLDNIEIQCRQLFDKRGRLLDLNDILKDRQLDVVEDSGLREYLPDTVYRDLTRDAHGALRPGGLMVTSNMNEHRPQKEFLHGLMGWPIPVQHRTIQEGVNLHREAGISPSSLQVQVVPSGVYTVFASTK